MNARAQVVRAVVADDEPAGREAILTLLAEYPQIQVVGEATNGEEAVEVVRRTNPDLLFLDIQMPDADGFHVLALLGSDVPRGVVFVTAHDEHAIQAFEVHALDYVLKPFGRPRFAAAVARALHRLDAMAALTLQRTLASMANDRQSLIDPAISGPEVEPGPANSKRTPLRRLGVRIGSKVVLVDVDAIDWLEALGDYVRVHAGKQTYLVAQAMQLLEQELSSGGFLRIHRSILVRLTRIRELHRDADGSGAIVLDDGVRLRVARGRWEMLEAALQMRGG